MENLVHYAARPFTGPLQSATQSGGGMANGLWKPHGFWFSVEDGGGDGWREWCEAERFALDRLACAHDVVLAADANVLHIVGETAIDDFTREFTGEMPDIDLGRHNPIDWPAVAERWQGIIIAPYVWNRRLDGNAGWYYSWDCSSGCVWDAAAVASVVLRPASGLPARAAENDLPPSA